MSERMPPGTVAATLSAAARAPLVIWDPNDALADLFSVWFGRFPAGDYASKQQAALASGRDEVRVAPGQLPPLEDPPGPIGWTTTCLEYRGFHGGPCIVASRGPASGLRWASPVRPRSRSTGTAPPERKAPCCL